jgi:hypothetical protein
MVNPETKLPKVSVFACALIGALLVSGSPSALAQTQMSEAQAKLGAQARFSKWCSVWPKCSAVDFTGPMVVSVDGAAFAYEWKSTTKEMPKAFRVWRGKSGGWYEAYIE